MSRVPTKGERRGLEHGQGTGGAYFGSFLAWMESHSSQGFRTSNKYIFSACAVNAFVGLFSRGIGVFKAPFLILGQKGAPDRVGDRGPREAGRGARVGLGGIEGLRTMGPRSHQGNGPTVGQGFARVKPVRERGF